MAHLHCCEKNYTQYRQQNLELCAYSYRHTDTRSKVSVRKLSLVPNGLGTRLRTQKAQVESSHEPKATLTCGLLVTKSEVVQYHIYVLNHL